MESGCEGECLADSLSGRFKRAVWSGYWGDGYGVRICWSILAVAKKGALHRMAQVSGKVFEVRLSRAGVEVRGVP